tara:strand:- start:3107 stop:3559 length:453 start_codon:yes stop_codon:yes gene_type:complete
LIKVFLCFLFLAQPIKASVCKNVFENGKNPNTVVKMKELREIMWQIEELLYQLRDGQDVYTELQQPLSEAIALSRHLYENANEIYMPAKALDIEIGKRYLFLQHYERAYQILQRHFERLSDAAKQRASYEEIRHRVARIKDYSTRMHYRF